MSNCHDILISVAPCHTEAILSGRKTVELRRRRMHISSGTRVWIYSKVPAGRVEATALVDCVHQADPESLWLEYQDRVGISRAAFDEYFAGCAQGCAVELRDVFPVTPAMQLAHLRAEFGGFHPPQFFKRLHREEIQALRRRQRISA